MTPDKYPTSAPGQNAKWRPLAARQLISEKQTSLDTLPRSATGHERTPWLTGYPLRARREDVPLARQTLELVSPAV